MKLSKEDVLKIAKLSRLELTDREVDTFAGQMSEVLNYVKKLDEVDTEGVVETSQVTGLVNVFRKDEIIPSDDSVALVKQATEHEDNQIKVKNVL